MKKVEEIKNIILENDFEEAQRILDIGEYTKNFDSEYLYNEREESENFNRIFKVKVERTDDYKRFLTIMESEKRAYIQKEKNKVYPLYERGLVTRSEALKLFSKIENEALESKLSKFSVTFEEWKSNKLKNGQRLGKALRKAGFSKELLDFYSEQVKTEKEIFLTITDKVQYIAGMSYYSNMEWDGMNGSSCQDPRHGGSYSKHLAGSLHDDKLYVGLLHESLDDLQDMEEKLLGRVVLRLLEDFEGKESILVATRYYGNNETKSLLHEALKQIESIAPIYSNDALGYERYKETANGYVNVETIKDIHIYENRIEYIDIECPLCNGDGDIYGYDEQDNEYSVCCPHCEGSGTVEIEHEVYVDEWVEIELEDEVLPYNEDYIHNGYSIEIDLNKEYIIDKMEEREHGNVKEGV
jgi:hypothetical protein